MSRIRERLLRDGILTEDGDHYVFTEDFPFDTRSGAAVALLGRHTIGWTKWKDAAGETLDELKRQAAAPPADRR